MWCSNICLEKQNIRHLQPALQKIPTSHLRHPFTINGLMHYCLQHAWFASLQVTYTERIKRLLHIHTSHGKREKLKITGPEGKRPVEHNKNWRWCFHLKMRINNTEDRKDWGIGNGTKWSLLEGPHRGGERGIDYSPRGKQTGHVSPAWQSIPLTTGFSPAVTQTNHNRLAQ